MTRDGNEDDDRRAFLKTCGRFAAVTPPVMTLLLSTSLTSKAIASSGGLHGGGRTTGASRSSTTTGRPRRGRGTRAEGHLGAAEQLAVVEQLVVALLDHLVPDGHPAVAAVAAGPVLAEAVAKGRSRPAGALEFEARMVGSIAQTKRRRKSARPIAPELILGFRAQSNPAGRSLLSPCMSAMGRRAASNTGPLLQHAESVAESALSKLWLASAEGSDPKPPRF